MTLANNAFPDMSADAILGQEENFSMAHAGAKSNQFISPEFGAHQAWKAVVARDRSHDGKFVFAVSTTGIYCRPSCPARRPRRENVRFFAHPENAENAGFRACL